MKFAVELLGERVFCSELSLKEYKEILKITFGDEPSPEIFAVSVCDLLSQLTNKPSTFFEELNVYELVSLIIDIRAQSMGNTASVKLTKGEKEYGLELDFIPFKSKLLQLSNQFKKEIDLGNDVSLVLTPPGVKKLLESASEEYLYFIAGLSVRGSFHKIETVKDASEVFDRLSSRTAKLVLDYFRELIRVSVETNFLDKYKDFDQKIRFVPSISSIILFTKVMFNESLSGFYDNIFALARYGKMNSLYIEQCTPGEYIYFVKTLQRSLPERNQANNNETAVDASLSDDTGLDPFGGEP